MSFLHLSLLAGLGMVSIPILLHLFGRSQPQLLDFPALRFVRETTQEQSMSWQLRHMLLLLLRGLLLAALAIALARPRVHSAMLSGVLTGSILAGCAAIATLVAAVALASRRPKQVWLTAAAIALALWLGAALWGVRTLTTGPSVPNADQSAPVAAALIVDNGPTMTYRTENTTRLELARNMALWILEQLPIESRVGVLTNVPIGSLALDPSTAKSQVKLIEARGAHVDLLGRVRTALDLVLRSEFERKEIYVLTDLSSTSWSATQSDLAQLLGENSEQVLVQIIDVAKEDQANVRLGTVTADFETVPAGGDVEFSVEVHRASTTQESLTVELFQEAIDPTRPVIRDEKLEIPKQSVVDRKVAEFGANSVATISLQAKDLEPGTHNFVIRLVHADPLPIDNERYFSILSQTQKPTLIVANDEGVGQNLQAIVDPQSIAANSNGATRVDRVRYVQLADVPLENYAVICLYDPTPMTGQLTKALLAHVSSGGGLLVILGPGLGTLEGVSGNPITQLLPGELSGFASRSVDDPTVFPEPVALTHPVFFAFGQSPDSIPWNVYPIYQNWKLSKLADATITLMQLSDNSAPFLTLQARGRGNIITLSSPIPEFDSRDRPLWNLLWASDPMPAFALLLGSFRSLSGSQQEKMNYEVGQMVSLSNDPLVWPSLYDLYQPEAKQWEPVQRTATEGTLNLGEFDLPGVYRLRGQRAEAVSRAFSLNVPEIDTILERMEVADLDERLGSGNYRLARERNEVESSVGQARFGQELYPLMMVLVAGLFLAEQAMSNRFYQIKFRK